VVYVYKHVHFHIEFLSGNCGVTAALSSITGSLTLSFYPVQRERERSRESVCMTVCLLLAVKYGDYNGQETLPHYTGSADGYTTDGYTGGPSNHHMVNDPFTVQEIRLMRQVSGFGFRIIGGKEEGSQATVGAIVPGGTADVDGRLQVGDEITHINGLSVVDAPHQNVISTMGEAAAQGEVVLKIRRKMPLPESLPPTHGEVGPVPVDEELPVPPGVREVQIDRPNIQTSFGFVLQSNTLRPGCMICRLVPGSPAETCGLLHVGDELLAVNGQDVSQMDHSDIVSLIKSSGMSIHLTVQQPDPGEMDYPDGQQMGNGWDLHQGQEGSGYPQQQQPYPDYPLPTGPPSSEPQHQEEDVGPQITADIDRSAPYPTLSIQSSFSSIHIYFSIIDSLAVCSLKFERVTLRSSC
jgi:hypothetical protein